jgi:hypothetical protein
MGCGVGAAKMRRMCRNIRPLFNFEPPTTDDEVRAAALQFVRKISGFAKPSLANRAPFDACVEEIAASAARMLSSLDTHAPARDRETEMKKAKARSAKRYPSVSARNDTTPASSSKR